jgi:hypothetical protein
LKPGDALYKPYDQGFQLERFPDVIDGHRLDILGVVVAVDDVQAMCEHGAAQVARR